MLRNAKVLERFELRASDGNIGHVHDFFFDDRQWTIRYFVADTGTWLDGRRVLISPTSVTAPEWERRVLAVDLTRAQVEQSPGVDTQQPVSREVEAALTQYYSWPVYWGAVGFPDVGFMLPMTPIDGSAGRASERAQQLDAPAASGGDHHLRSVRSVTGYAIEATDGPIGHVDDFLIDDATWEIRYLVGDTRNWWPGKKVLVAPQWIDEVGWSEAKVYIELTRHALKSSPPYDPLGPLAPEYLEQLHVHDRSPTHAG